MPFNFFQLWKKSEPKVKVPFSDIPIFSSLGPAELNLIENHVRRVEFKKGDMVYRIGEKPEAFYIILLGRFRVVGPKGDTITILSQGDYFGESSILLNRPHSATIEAKNDGLVLRIDKKDFQNLLSEIPALSLHLSRTLGHRLTAGASRTGVSKTKVISAFDYNSSFEKECLISNLAAGLSQMKKKTIVVGIESAKGGRFAQKTKKELSLINFGNLSEQEIQETVQEEPGGFYFLAVASPGGEQANGGIASLVGYLTDRYEFIIFDLPKEFNDQGIKALQQSDAVYFLTNEDNRVSIEVTSLLKEFKSSFGFTTDEIRLIVFEKEKSEYKSAPFPLNSSLMNPVFMFIPFEGSLYANQKIGPALVILNQPEKPYSKAVRFLVRELTGKLVGLALGSGAAYGFAHIGVIKALEKEQIPVDIVAGSSIGALVGAIWTTGRNSSDLEQIATSLDQKSAFLKIIGFRDFSLPHHGFFKGDQVSRYLRGFLEQKTFRDLAIPLKIVGTNLFTGEEVIFDEGDVVEAVRVSISIPGIFHPVKIQNQFFMDGGVVDPLPIKVLNRYGVKKIIAVNVLSASEDHARRYELSEARKTRIEELIKKKNILVRAWHGLTSRFKGRYQANVFNVLMNTIQFLEYGIAESSVAGADVVIHPVLPDSHWAEFYSAAKFIKCGEEQTVEQMSEIKRLIEET